MPFVFLQDDLEWPDDVGDDFEMPPPKPADFGYLSPPDFGGKREPVRFSDAPPNSPEAKAVANLYRAPFLLRISDWFFGLTKQEAQQQRSRAQLFSVLVPALRGIGIRQVKCVYDGGNDEGFAWIKSLKTTNASLSVSQAVEQLLQTEVMHQLADSGLPGRTAIGEDNDEKAVLQETLNDWLAPEWGSLLLGDGFGTGDYSMYGAFTVDLLDCIITDDRNAGVPEHCNIEITKENA